MSHGEHEKAAKTEHTPEPWRVELVNHALGDTGDYEGVVEIRSGDAKRPMIEIWDDSDEAEANARRIVACVNACAGIPTDDLEHGDIAKALKIFALDSATFRRQRDELLAELEELSLYVAYNGDDWVQKKARAAIASVKGRP